MGPSEMFLVGKPKEHVPCFPMGNTDAVEWSAGLSGEVMSKLWKHEERDFPFRMITLVSRDKKERTAGREDTESRGNITVKLPM